MELGDSGATVDMIVYGGRIHRPGSEAKPTGMLEAAMVQDLFFRRLFDYTAFSMFFHACG